MQKISRGLACFGALAWSAVSIAQEYGRPDQDNPGDAMIQSYLGGRAERMEGSFAEEINSADEWRSRLPGFGHDDVTARRLQFLLGEWKSRLPRYREEYLYMLGLWPLPERTSLAATVTGTLAGDGFVVEKLHYQSRPGLYVTGNLYRPREVAFGAQLPAVLYVCGHDRVPRNGNKTAYQSHGIWFARHGYVCLIVDTLQWGEIGAIHHGTYRENRWWWHSRGYTSAGVECWNGVRGIDYLITRPDVDPQRIAVTGISGGGAATIWIAAADERVAVAVPVSGMADLPSYVSHRVINGHCDCIFLYNTFGWPWTRIAELVAPRPLLFVNSDTDRIFPMDANERVVNRLERLYMLYGAGDRVDAFVSAGGHAYRRDVRQAAYRFVNTYLKNDPRPIEDSEVDLVTDAPGGKRHAIPPELLRVFPTDADLPADQLNTTIDQHFVPLAKVAAPPPGRFDSWKRDLLAELRRVTFRTFPERIPPAQQRDVAGDLMVRLETEPGILVLLKQAQPSPEAARQTRIRLLIQAVDDPISDWVRSRSGSENVYVLEPRGIGRTRWTEKNPPNYIRRSHVLLGRTADTGRVWDVIAAARYLKLHHGDNAELSVVGEGANGLLAAYAAVFEPEIAEVVLRKPPPTHMDATAPQFLNILRVCDVPEMFALLAPRPLTIAAGDQSAFERTSALYAAAGAAKQISR